MTDHKDIQVKHENPISKESKLGAMAGLGLPSRLEAKSWLTKIIGFLKEWFFPGNWEDGDFMDDVRQATLRGAHPMANLLFWTCAIFLLIMLIWASVAELDEVTAGQGKVIPSSQVQTIQNLEGGIISEILVHEGDIVQKGEIMMRIDDTGFASSYSEKRTRFLTLQAGIARLQAEIQDESPVFPADVTTEAPEIIESENNLYLSRQEELQNTVDIFKQQVTQKEQELKELKSRKEQTARTYKLSKQELDLTKPLLKKGVVSKVEILRLEREVNNIRGEMDFAAIAVPKAESAIREANSRLEEAIVKFRSTALNELAEKKEEYSRLSEVMRAVKDQVDRTTVKAPVRGTVKQVLVTTVGGVIQPGMDLIEVVPLEDSLLVEAKIRPKDIAFIRPNQKAKVKITAYDYSIFGGLDAELVHIGVDTVADEKGEPFYHIRVRTNKNHLERKGEIYPIIPGMVASVDILTGKKTVLDYILKPFRKMSENAMRER